MTFLIDDQLYQALEVQQNSARVLLVFPGYTPVDLNLIMSGWLFHIMVW